MKYFLIAGEASGDIHAADLILSIRKADSKAEFRFFGGDLMAEASETEPILHYRNMAYMGFSETFRHLHDIMVNMRKAKAAIRDYQPDALILIDLPSFNLKVAKFAHKAGIPVYYYISPKVWAWKEYRVKQIKKYCRRVLSIFPFEVDFYRRHGYEVDFVGNPSVVEVDKKLAALPPREYFLKKHNLGDRPLLALVPGSRKGEIRNNLPVMIAASQHFPQYRPVIAGAPGIELKFYRYLTNLPVVTGETFDLVAHSRGALVTSGTATLETALIGTPQIVCYRANGSRISYKLMSAILKVKFVALPNLIAGEKIIPELLLHLCSPELISEYLAKILPDGFERSFQLKGYAEMRRKLGNTPAPDNAARLITSDLGIQK